MDAISETLPMIDVAKVSDDQILHKYISCVTYAKAMDSMHMIGCAANALHTYFPTSASFEDPISFNANYGVSLVVM